MNSISKHQKKGKTSSFSEKIETTQVLLKTHLAQFHIEQNKLLALPFHTLIDIAALTDATWSSNLDHPMGMKILYVFKFILACKIGPLVLWIVSSIITE